MDGISIAVKNDVAALNFLINSAYRGDSAKQGWTHEAELLDGTRINETELYNLLERENTFILKYMEAHEICACVLLEKKVNKLYIGMLTVAPGLQGHGIGKKLLKSAEEKAREMNCSCTEITVIDARHELIGWYERHGYGDTGTRIPFDADMQKRAISTRPLQFIVMEKIL
ncbi:MAG: GNAT family N-acetyltransferase [Ginsengibacter sp.]